MIQLVELKDREGEGETVTNRRAAYPFPFFSFAEVFAKGARTSHCIVVERTGGCSRRHPLPPFCAELVRLTDSTRDGTATPSLVTGGGCNKRAGQVAWGRILKIDRPYCKVMLCQSFSTIHLKHQSLARVCVYAFVSKSTFSAICIAQTELRLPRGRIFAMPEALHCECESFEDGPKNKNEIGKILLPGR